MILEGRDGFTYMIEYNGKINDKGEDAGDNEGGMVVNSLGAGTENTSYSFFTYKAEGDNFTFDLIVNNTNAKATTINPGSYMYSPMGKQLVGNPGYFYLDAFKVDGVKYTMQINSTMVVEGDGNNVNITINAYANTGETFVVKYDGVVGGSANQGGNVELTKLETPTVVGMVAGNAATISWNEIAGAKDYTVTLNGTDVQTVETAYVVFQGLEYDTTYSVSVVANPADAAVNSASDAGTATFTTEAAPVGGDEGGNDTPAASFENWVFDATLDKDALLVTCTDGSHTVTFKLNEISGGTFYLHGDGVLNITEVTVNGVVAEEASGTMEMSSSSNYFIVLNAYIDGVHYTGTSNNPVV